MQNIQDRLNSLKQAINEASTKKLRAEMAAETALSERDEALASLKKLGAESPEQAERLLAELNRKLDETLTQAERLLEDVD